MNAKKLVPVCRGLTAVTASLLALSTIGYGIADTYRSNVDAAFGTSSYIIDEDTENARFKSDYATPEEMMAAARAHAVRQGEEGTVIMKNDNGALPLQAGKKIALFGAAAWKPYMQSTGDLKAGNDDAVNLDDALKAAGFTLDATMETIYRNILHDYTVSTRFGNTTVTYTNGYVTSPGDMTEYQIREVPPDKYTDRTLIKEEERDEWLNVADNWKSSIDKTNTIAVCAFARGAGESNTYAPGKAKNFAGETIDRDPLALSPDELAVIDAAKETCGKVIVLINSGNAMELGEIARGGAHEVDAIAYMGVVNDYQCEGIVNVLSGKADATGALPDTYAIRNASAPAVNNFGGDYYADADIADAVAGTSGEDPRFPGVSIRNGNSDDASFGSNSYSGGQYIVEAEGIYVGYKYYETRYYDGIANPWSKAHSAKGATDGEGWDYGREVVYPFGHGLSYLDYEQNIRSVSVDKSPEGNITATVDVINKSDRDGYFLAQLYVQQPYTDYDRTNLVEKSAIAFLNSAKVKVEAGRTASVQISVPARYLASYDYKNAQTYILDEGKYFFTAAAGAHEAVNNVLTEQGYTVEEGMDAAGRGACAVWENGAFDKTTYAADHGNKVTNVADNADLNYWLPGTVTYLSRSDWEGTYPKNYNADVTVTIADSAKKDEWIREIRGQQYTVDNTGSEARNVDGRDNGIRFSTEHIGYDQLTDVNDEYWDTLISSISVNEAVGAVLHGGGQSDTLTYVDNPVVGQNEGVNGIKGSEKSTDGTKEYKYNVNSQTLLGSSFNPELAHEWGLIQGNAGLHLQKYAVWGTGLTQRRTPYNGRNYEYISEDPMLTNRIGYGILLGCRERGVICGPKHMGFNDQEHNRAGVAVYMNEQKMRETDLRGFQGGLEDAGGLAVMVAFNRIGATNASHHAGMLKTILRDEWGFTGIVSTDLASSKYYFNAESMIMATVTQVAEFGGNNSYISKDNNPAEGDSKWGYISVNSVKNDCALVEQARQNLKYQLYTFANSAVMNINTIVVVPSWEVAIRVMIGMSAALTAVAGVAWLALSFVPGGKEDV